VRGLLLLKAQLSLRKTALVPKTAALLQFRRSGASEHGARGVGSLGVEEMVIGGHVEVLDTQRVLLGSGLCKPEPSSPPPPRHRPSISPQNPPPPRYACPVSASSFQCAFAHTLKIPARHAGSVNLFFH
jgi:hypothetical protein